jgi:hypothetical protein
MAMVSASVSVWAHEEDACVCRSATYACILFAFACEGSHIPCVSLVHALVCVTTDRQA